MTHVEISLDGGATWLTQAAVVRWSEGSQITLVADITSQGLKVQTDPYGSEILIDTYELENLADALK